MPIDYSRIGFKCGIEIHQELDTGKLFCDCSTSLGEKDEISRVTRRLNAVSGETGSIDRSALFESKRKRRFVYHGYEGECCLVDMDAQPPKDMNPKAKRTALLFAMMLNMQIPHEIHVMRKTVTDGSATSGFQRTALVALDNDMSYLETSKGKVYLESMALEEDACRKIETKGDEVHYSLSRLGIPLIEIATAPDMKDPEHVKETALRIGSLLRSFSETKRGIGTIRQDINISIHDGPRTEIKGWQDINRTPLLVDNEVKRHMFLNSLRDELIKDKISLDNLCHHDVTDVFKDTGSKLIGRLIKGDGIVLAASIPGFAGRLKEEMCPGKTFGKELAGYGASFGARGMIHTDEDLSRYHLEEEFGVLKEKLGAGKDDLVLMVAGMPDVSRNAIDAILDRISACVSGVPEETRVPNHADATSSYARPLSGSHRMYPETDIATIVIDDDYLESIRGLMPETLEAKEERFRRELKLNSELSSAIISSPYLGLFQRLVGMDLSLPPKDIANFFVNTLVDFRKREDADLSAIDDDRLIEIFRCLDQGRILKDTLPILLKRCIEHPEMFIDEVITNFNLGPVSSSEAQEIIDDIISKNKDAPKGAIIGQAMGRLKGKYEGRKIAELVNRKLSGKD